MVEKLWRKLSNILISTGLNLKTMFEGKSYLYLKQVKYHLTWCNVLWSTGSDFVVTYKSSVAGCLSKCYYQYASQLLITNFKHDPDQVMYIMALTKQSA